MSSLRLGPCSERTWSPPQTNGGTGPSPPVQTAWPGPATCCRPVQEVLGGGGAEVGLLYLGISDEFEKLLVLTRSLQAVVRGLAGLCWELDSRVSRGAPGTQAPLGPTSGSTAQCRPPPPASPAAPCSPFSQGHRCHKMAGPPFPQPGSEAGPGPQTGL